jgi:hypothetical protein
MLMKKGDFIWALIMIAMIGFIAAPATNKIFMEFTGEHPYVSGFIKFSILATMGELLAVRIMKKDWSSLPKGIPYRALVWGMLGMLIVLAFEIYGSGVISAQEKGLLPRGGKIVYAFTVSTLLNTTFAPMLMGTHKITDTYIDLVYKNPGERPTLAVIAETIDWKGFLSFVIMKTLPLFWIPAHTITFLLPPEYKVLFAASLSLALGLILAFAKSKPAIKA